MPRYLLTPSLYSSWSWYASASAEDDGEARAALISALKREPVEPTEAMLKGIRFEDDVRAVASGQLSLPFETPQYEAAVSRVAEIVKGGLWQERIYHDLTLRDHGDFLLYGRIDVIKGPWIYDIKWTKSYELGKYAKGIQHAAYMAGSGCPKFAYLVSNGRDFWREDYFSPEAHYEQMRARLNDMLDDIKRDKELSALYAEHWKADP